MEEIYPPENYGASIHFPLKNYFEEFSNVFSNELPAVTRVDGEINETEYLLAIKELMGVDLLFNDIKRLAQTCSIENLTCEGEDTKNFPIEVPVNICSSSKLPSPFVTTEADNLSVNKSLQELDTQKTPLQLCFGNKRSYHNTLEFITPSTPPDVKPGSDFLISVLIYRPVAFKFYNGKNASEKLKFNHEIVALGRSTLAELRDTILCSSEDGICKEVESTTTDLKQFADAKNIYPSGFIFIDDVFYNDFRSPKSIDYSYPIIEWAKEKKIKGLSSRDMGNITIDSLKPRFGYPYLYMHQGDCEHLLVFADAKLLEPSDCLHSSCYPHVLKLNRNANRMCFMCSVSFAKWICVGSDRLPQHKVFLCSDCCNSYNYSDGEKLGNFKLYPYYEKHVFI